MLVRFLKAGQRMSVESRLSALLDAAESLGIEVRQMDLGGQGGGLCTVRGKRVLFVDLGTDRATRYDLVLREIAQLSEIDTIYLRPEIREDIEQVRAET